MKINNKILISIGYILLFLSCLMWILILIIPWFNFSKSSIGIITLVLIVLGELFLYLSLLILGKSFFEKIKEKIKFWKK